MVSDHNKGSHRQFMHPIKKGKVTIAGKLSDEPGCVIDTVASSADIVCD
jgi:predicted RNA binding protein YcfA (HicA-like mRNA interferase family)